MSHQFVPFNFIYDSSPLIESPFKYLFLIVYAASIDYYKNPDEFWGHVYNHF